MKRRGSPNRTGDIGATEVTRNISAFSASWSPRKNCCPSIRIRIRAATCIDRIPKIERTVLSLYYFEELNLREIAEVTGMHLSRIAQLRVQAVLRLRSHLDRVWKLQGKNR